MMTPRSRTVRARTVFNEWMTGRSILGCARKYGRTKAQIEEMIQRERRRRR